MEKLTNTSDFFNQHKALVDQIDSKKTMIVVCGGTGCIALGAVSVHQAFKEEVQRLGLTDKVTLKSTGCHGFCEKGPAVVIHPDRFFYPGVKPDDVAEILERTVMAGEAAQKAAQDVKGQLAGVAAEKWEADPQDIVFKNQQVYVKDSPEKAMPFRKLAQIACYSGSGAVIVGKGYSQYGVGLYDFDKGLGDSGTSYSFTSHLTEVDVDMETGFVKCSDMVIAHDCGKPLNPINVEAQNQGGAIQAMGQAMARMIFLLNSCALKFVAPSLA